MPDQGFNPQKTVPAVVIDLLLLALPTELKGIAGMLARAALARAAVGLHVEKRWGELSEAEGDAIANECGLVARDAITRRARG